jgi:hypothetical protein
VLSISFRPGSTVSTQTKCAIYTDNGSGTAPQSLVTNSISNEVKQTSNAWNTYTFSTNPMVNDNTSYWLAFHSASNLSIRLSGLPTNNIIGYQTRDYSSGFPSRATHSNMGSASDVDWYITVQPNSTVLFHKGTYSSNPNGLIRNGSLMANVNLKADLHANTEWCYDSTNQAVYVYGDPSVDTVEIPVRARAVHTNGKDYLTFQNLQLESGTNSAFYVSTGSDNIILSNSIIKNAYYGYDISSTAGNNQIIDNCHISYCYNNGITLYGSGQTGLVISNTEVDHCGTTPSPQFHTAPSGIMTHNVGDLLLERNNIHNNGTSTTSDSGGLGCLDRKQGFISGKLLRV